ncbi:hypothetical protein ACM9HF_00030 [Colwellia sp. RE-S-Sl-9]
MSGSESFISYMKTMREYHKSGATSSNAQPKSFDFDYVEYDANLYGFISNNRYNAKIKDTDSNGNERATTENKQQEPMRTDIITINLFEQNDIEANTVTTNFKKKPPSQKIPFFTIKDKISAALSKFIQLGK